MKKFFTPGPTHLFPTVQEHLQRALEAQIPSFSHRSQTFKDLYAESVEGLRAVFQLPSEWGILFFASATEIWERLIQNCVDSHSFHFVNGSFSQRFYDAAVKLHRSPSLETVDWGKGFDFLPLPQGVEMINFTRNETSTGVMTPPEFIYRYKEVYPNTLLTVDVVSSAPYTNWDWSQIDAAYFSVQKCFGLPSGLGVLMYGPGILDRARARKETGNSLGTYHSFVAMAQKAEHNQTVETPNILGIYLLGKVCQDILATGVETLRTNLKQRASLLYDFFDAHPEWKPFVQNPNFRSQTVVVVDIPQGSHPIIQQLAEKGLVVGDGYGKMKGKQIRIANFPALGKQDITQLLTELGKLS